jgi:hypothetical protein
VPQPTLPVTATWAAGPVPAAALRSSVSAAVQLLSGPPMFSGSQTATGQSIPSGTIKAFDLDTEAYDNFSGHQISVNKPTYYGMFPGWYLCTASAPFGYTGGTGQTGACVGGVQNGGADQSYGGMRVQNGSGNNSQATASKLMQMVSTGTYAGASNDYLYGVAYQSNGGASNETLLNSASQNPYLTARWVCANSGAVSLPVPANPAWPVPPSIVTSAFLNANARDACRFLTYPPICEYYRPGTGGSLASQSSLPLAGTTISLTGAVVDNYSGFASSTYTAPVAGRYWCYGCAAITSAVAAVAHAAGLTVTSANYNGGTQVTLWGGLCGSASNSPNGAVVHRQLRLNAGDTVSLAGWQNTTGSVDATFASNGLPWASRLILVWQGS